VDGTQWTAVQSGVSTLGLVSGFGALAQGTFTLRLRDTDAAGNVGQAQVELVKDTVAPAGYGVAVVQSVINAANQSGMTFTLSGGEAGTQCQYVVQGAGKAGTVSGSFAVTAAPQTSPAIDVSSLSDGLLTVAVTLQDSAGNMGAAGLLLARAAELDPGWNEGAIYEIYLSYYASLPAFLGGDRAKALDSYRRALDYSGGRSASLFVSYATAICMADDDYAGFKEALGKALAIDPAARPEARLATVLARDKAAWLLANASRYFSIEEGE